MPRYIIPKSYKIKKKCLKYAIHIWISIWFLILQRDIKCELRKYLKLQTLFIACRMFNLDKSLYVIFHRCINIWIVIISTLRSNQVDIHSVVYTSHKCKLYLYTPFFLFLLNKHARRGPYIVIYRLYMRVGSVIRINVQGLARWTVQPKRFMRIGPGTNNT